MVVRFGEQTIKTGITRRGWKIQLRKRMIPILLAGLILMRGPSLIAAGFDMVPRDHWSYGALRAVHTTQDVKTYLDDKLGGDKPVLKYNFALAIVKVMTRGGQAPPWEVISSMSHGDLTEMERIIPFFMEELQNLDFQPDQILGRIRSTLKSREQTSGPSPVSAAVSPQAPAQLRGSSPGSITASRIRSLSERLSRSSADQAGSSPIQSLPAQAPAPSQTSGIKTLPGDGRQTVNSSSLLREREPWMVRLRISPSSARVAAGQKVQFKVFGIYSDNAIKPLDIPVKVDRPLGTISPDNSFSAVRIGQATVSVVDQNSRLSAAAEVVVTAAEISRITMEPSEVTLQPGQSAKFTARATDRFGNSVEEPFVWKATGDCGKAVDGSYLAITPGTGMIYATSSDGRVYDNARITVLPMAVAAPPAAPAVQQADVEKALGQVRDEILRRDREQSLRMESLKDELKREMAGVIGRELRTQQLTMDKRAAMRQELTRVLNTGSQDSTQGEADRFLAQAVSNAEARVRTVDSSVPSEPSLLDSIRKNVERAIEIGIQPDDASGKGASSASSRRASGKTAARAGSRPSAGTAPSQGVRIFRLRHMESAELVKALGSGVFGNLEGMRWTEDARTNTVTVSAPVKALETIARFLEITDIASRQVRIEARIMEVTLGKSDSTGVDWTMLMPSGGAAKAISDENAISVSLPGPSGDGAATLKFGTLSIEQFQAVISNLSDTQNVKLVSNPSITTMSGKTASILVGQVFPIAKWTVNENTGKYEIIGYDEKKIGINLEVTPTVTESGVVKLKVIPKVEDVVNYVGQFNERPVTFTRSAETEVEICDTQTLVIGGLIRESNDTRLTKVPILGEIPGLKHLFQRKTRIKERKETVIFITPSIVTEEEKGGELR